MKRYYMNVGRCTWSTAPPTDEKQRYASVDSMKIRVYGVNYD